MYTRLTAVGCHDERDWCTRTATAVLASEVSATSPSIPAVLRPVLRCVTCRTLTSVFDRLRSFSCLASTTHLLTSARFRARAPGPVSGQLCETASGGAGPGVLTGCLVFLLPFGCRHSLVEHPVPPRDSAPLTIGLPHRHRQRGPDGVSTFRTHQTRLGPV